MRDVKTDPRHHLPPDAVVVMAVTSTHITVQVYMHNATQITTMTPVDIRARVSAICERYCWRSKTDATDCRYTHSCKVRFVRGRHDAELIGALLK